MTKDEALKLALEALETLHDENMDYLVRNKLGGENNQCMVFAREAITAIKEALAKEKALQALHNENERLGLYKDAYAQPEQKPVGKFAKFTDGIWREVTNGSAGVPLYTTPPAQRKEKNT